MNPSLLGVVAVALAAGLWLAGRRPRPLLKSTDARDVAALNRAQNTLVWEARQTLQARPGEAPFSDGHEALWAPLAVLRARPKTQLPAHEKQLWLRELKRHYQTGGEQRLEALRLARAWGHREVIPLLRQGLRDPDPRVMREAALAMEAFRGRPTAKAPPAQAGAAPRKVARIR
jgi:hypothetical protein